MTPWVRHTPERALNRKLREAGFAARGLDDAAICQVAADDSDSYISEATVEMLAVAHKQRQWRPLVKILCDVGRWHEVEGGWIIHDYEEFNMTKAYWEEQRAKKRLAGKAGGRPPGKANVKADAFTDGKTGD